MTWAPCLLNWKIPFYSFKFLQFTRVCPAVKRSVLIFPETSSHGLHFQFENQSFLLCFSGKIDKNITFTYLYWCVVLIFFFSAFIYIYLFLSSLLKIFILILFWWLCMFYPPSIPQDIVSFLFASILSPFLGLFFPAPRQLLFLHVLLPCHFIPKLMFFIICSPSSQRQLRYKETRKFMVRYLLTIFIFFIEMFFCNALCF